MKRVLKLRQLVVNISLIAAIFITTGMPVIAAGIASENNSSVLMTVIEKDENSSFDELENLYKDGSINLEYRSYIKENGVMKEISEWHTYEPGVDLESGCYQLRYKDTKKSITQEDIPTIIALLNINEFEQQPITNFTDEVTAEPKTTPEQRNPNLSPLEQQEDNHNLYIFCGLIGLGAFTFIFCILRMTAHNFEIRGTISKDLSIGIDTTLKSKHKSLDATGAFFFKGLDTETYTVTIFRKQTREVAANIRVVIRENNKSSIEIISNTNLAISSYAINNGMVIEVISSSLGYNNMKELEENGLKEA